MPAIPTIASGDTSSAATQFNVLVEALASIGITDTEQLFAIFTELRLKDATTWTKRDGSDLALRDAVSGSKKLKEIAGGMATPLIWGYGSAGKDDSLIQDELRMLPFRTKKTVTVLGLRVSTWGVNTLGKSIQGGIYDNGAPFKLQAGSPLSLWPDNNEFTLTFSVPATLIADSIYWMAVIAPGTYGRMNHKGAEIRPTIMLRGIFPGGLPQEIDRGDLTFGYYPYPWFVVYAPAMQLIIDGGMIYG